MTQRKHTEVAVGIILHPDGSMLLTSRPEGKPYAGYWEFPGGKLEGNETVAQALQRELYEELGIVVTRIAHWQVSEHDYPHALVRLHWCKVFEWEGEFEMKEGQSMAWQKFPIQMAPILPGALPILDSLQKELQT